MRVRKKKSGDARFLAHKDITLEYDREAPEMIHLNEIFPEYSRFRIEIGCGKGSFIIKKALENFQCLLQSCMNQLRIYMFFSNSLSIYF